MSEHAALLPRYKQLRQVAYDLHNRLVKELPRDILDEGGNKLGMMHGNVITLDSPDLIAVLADYCLYDVRRKGLTTIERYLAESPPPAGSDEWVVLQAMQQARYSIVAVEGRETGVGVQARDLLRNESVFLFDVGFSQTATRGLVLATRIMAADGLSQTTGAALPIGMLPDAQQEEFRDALLSDFKVKDIEELSPEWRSDMTAAIIRLALKFGAGEHIQYREPEAAGASARVPPSRSIPQRSEPPPRRHIGRNDPCYCGSGKKFKHCCGARR